MMLSINLQNAVSQAKKCMLAQQQYALAPLERLRIYNTFFAFDRDLGYHAYLRLSFIVSTHVLHEWKQIWPNNQLPQSLLLTAEQVLTGVIDAKQATKIANDAWEIFDEMGGDIQSRAESSALQAAHAAYETLRACLGKSPFANVAIEEIDTDAEIDPWSSDTALWAVSAVAGGVWDPESDSEIRRQFWLWWLDEAIPSAWESVVSSPEATTS